MKRQDSKLCAVCNRPMTWRRKWAKSWDEVKYCSDACRRNKKNGTVQKDQGKANFNHR
jgi:hypothetical protein